MGILCLRKIRKRTFSLLIHFFRIINQQEDEVAFPAGDDVPGFSLLGDCNSERGLWLWLWLPCRTPCNAWPPFWQNEGFCSRAEERAEFTPNGDSSAPWLPWLPWPPWPNGGFCSRAEERAEFTPNGDSGTTWP